MPKNGSPSADSVRAERVRAGRLAHTLIVLLLVALVTRTLTDENTQQRLGWYAGLMGAFVVLFALASWRPRVPQGFLHTYLAAQSSLVIAMLAVNPEVDGVTAFIVPLAFQAALFFSRRVLWLWVALLSLITAVSLALSFGLPKGLALAMSPMAFIIALPALMIANREAEVSRLRSQALLEDLRGTQRKLLDYAGQVEELASLQERGRLARELHDTVSQLVFSITLTSRSAQLLLQRDPGRVREQLERLRELTGGALAQLRSLISQMRP